MKRILNTNNAPEPIGPYSQAVSFGSLVFFSGQVAIDPASGSVITGGVEEETHQVMKNIAALLKEAGLDWTHVIKTSIFLSDMDNFGTVNEVYGSYFTEDYPARETVEVSRLPKDVRVEISVIAGAN